MIHVGEILKEAAVDFYKWIRGVPCCVCAHKQAGLIGDCQCQCHDAFRVCDHEGCSHWFYMHGKKGCGVMTCTCKGFDYSMEYRPASRTIPWNTRETNESKNQ